MAGDDQGTGSGHSDHRAAWITAGATLGAALIGAVATIVITLTGDDGASPDAAAASTPAPSDSGRATGKAVSETATEDAVEAAVRDLVAATTGGDADAAWARVSTRCQGAVSRARWDASVALATERWGRREAEVSVIEHSGNRAVVTYQIVGTGSEGRVEDERWLREAGRWKTDPCP